MNSFFRFLISAFHGPPRVGIVPQPLTNTVPDPKPGDFQIVELGSGQFLLREWKYQTGYRRGRYNWITLGSGNSLEDLRLHRKMLVEKAEVERLDREHRHLMNSVKRIVE